MAALPNSMKGAEKISQKSKEIVKRNNEQ